MTGARSVKGDGGPVSRRVTAGDVIRLRSFGQIGEGEGDEALFTISPDRRSVALQLRRAEPATNSYCFGLVVVTIATGAARLIAVGGELIRPTYAHAGIMAGNFLGAPQVITPVWSPDGRWLALLRRDGGRTRAWRVRADGGAAEPLTDEAQDVTALAWSRDGTRIIYRTDRVLARSEHEIDAEGRLGWRYDDRFAPMFRARPYPRPGDPEEEVFTRDIATGSTHHASAVDRARLSEVATSSGSSEPVASEKPAPSTSAGHIADHQTSPGIVSWQHGRKHVCADPRCDRTRGFWAAADGGSVLFLARSGWGGDGLTFYRWSVATGRVSKLSSTTDLLTGCRPLGQQMLCAREGPLSPRRLALVDPVTGSSRTIFNPNPDFDALDRGHVERLHLTSIEGIETFADVVLPPDFDRRRRYPMVVVQYTSRGFLNGGTGDEFPILAFAAADMVVFSFQRPADVATRAKPAPETIEAFTRLDYEGWADRRNVHSALMDGVRQVLSRGFVDPQRIAITGLSDGIATAAFALLNSDVFSVAALSGCCEEPMMALALQGPAFKRWMLAAGLPGLSAPDPARWAGYSIAQEAGRVRAPMLIQAPDREYILSLPTYEALRETGLPVELYVYPGEFHNKWQPVHKLAVGERVLRWLAFWFGLPVPSGELAVPSGELTRWRAMRSAWHPSGPARMSVTHEREPTPLHR